MEWTMTALARPDVRLHASWAAAMDGVPLRDRRTARGCGCARGGAVDLTEAGCRRSSRCCWRCRPGPRAPRGPRALRLLLDHRRPGPTRRSSGSWRCGTRSTPGCSRRVVTSATRCGRRAAAQGHASRALGLAVRRAAELGIDRALVTCDDDNLAVGAHHRAQRRCLRGHPQRQAPLLDRRPGAGSGQWVTSSGRKNRRTRMKSSGSTIVASTVNGAMPRRRNSTFQLRWPG